MEFSETGASSPKGGCHPNYKLSYPINDTPDRLYWESSNNYWFSTNSAIKLINNHKNLSHLDLK